jgi:hypothetical protein
MATRFREVVAQGQGQKMTPRSIFAIPRQRYIALTIAAGVIAAISAIAFIGAPPIPAAVGVVIVVAWSIWRAPNA